MPTRSGKDGRRGARQAPDVASNVKESAQLIWLAGLGAFSKAQAERGKVFEALVKQGLALQQQSQSAAQEKLHEAGARMSRMASDISSRATGQWDKLENIFEERVAKSLRRLGVPSSMDFDALELRLSKLEAKLRSSKARPAQQARPIAAKGKPAKATKAGSTAAAKAPVKSARRKST